MVEVTIKVPEDIRDIISETSEIIYVEAIKEVARKRMSYAQKSLKELRKKIAVYEAKYGNPYEEFSQKVPDTIKGHDDWIEWSYLVKTAGELVSKIERTRFLIG